MKILLPTTTSIAKKLFDASKNAKDLYNQLIGLLT